ncbi:NusG domain II-containing protein [Flavonifractor plautii]|nr:NusG domain II-containing protein [Flavonifractor plautii]
MHRPGELLVTEGLEDVFTFAGADRGIPMRSPAAERRLPTLPDGVVALLVAAAAVALLFSSAGGEQLLTASVVLEGETIAEYELSTLTGPVTLVVDEAPYPLTIQAEPGRIRIAESACPSQDCVHTGGSAGPDSRSSACPTSW